MSETSVRHTPGPWRVSDEGCYLSIRSNEVQVAEIDSFDSDELTEANARLIAAAPDLLALLIESQEYIGGDWRKRRDEIIARTTT